MKNILTIALTSLLFAAHAQGADSKLKNSILHNVGSIHLSLLCGGYAPTGFSEIGLMVNRKAAARHHFAGRAAYASVESNRWMRRFNNRMETVFAPKAGIWWSAATSGLGVGASLVNYINVEQPKSVWAFRPEAGLAMGHVIIAYSYNMASREKLHMVNTHVHQFSVKLVIGLIRLSK